MNQSTTDLLAQAQQHISSKHFKRAKDIYARICSLNPTDTNAWNALGILSGQLGDFSEAERAFRQLIQIDPQNMKAHLNLGKVQESLNRVDDAEMSYRTATQLDSSGEALMTLGALLGRHSRFGEAEHCFRSLLELQPGNAMAHFSLAAALEQQNDNDSAIKHYREAVKLQPTLASAHNSLGVLLQKLGDTENAINAYQSAIHINPSYAMAYYNLGTCLNETCRYHEAYKNLQSALKINSKFLEARLTLGLVFEGIGNKNAAMDCYQQVIDHDPNNIPALTNLALIMQNKGQTNQATALYTRILDLAPETVAATCGLAGVHEINGDYAAANRLLKPLLDNGNEDIALALAYGSICSKLGQQDEAISLLEKVLSTQKLPAEKKSKTHYLLGKLYDEQGSYDEAFRHMQAANSIESHRYDPIQLETDAEKLKTIFSADNLSHRQRSLCHSDQPVFIVGMPRSGTTLVEQILASHPDVHGGGELTFISDIFQQLAHDAATSSDNLSQHLNQLTVKQLKALSQQYLDAVWQDAPRDKMRFTDKMPHNFQYIGLIEQLFPQARIIHCLRNPMDTCLSIFSTPFNASHSYATNMTALGHYYSHYYEELMSHWKSTSSIPILDLQYEALITNQEATTRMLLDFCDLEWNDSCLQFHNTRRAVATPSKNQVRQPLYQGSMQRWRHYEKQLQPLRNILGYTDQGQKH